MSDLVQFIRDRIDEDERAAQFVLDHCAFKDPQGAHVLKWGLIHIAFDQTNGGRQYQTDAICNERLNPERILADVAAKRELFDAAVRDMDYGGAEGAWAGFVLDYFLSSYAHHPDYSQKWILR